MTRILLPEPRKSGTRSKAIATPGAIGAIAAAVDAWSAAPLNAAFEAEIDSFAAMYRFTLDDFQREAIRTLLHGDSVMVAAPTGTGKTVVAEFGVWDSFKRAGRVFYTTPIKALSNQKYRDLRAVYGDEVGLLTGDVTENRDARVVVMTTEILRNMLLQTPWDLDPVECIIFDEIHYLADPERGTTWEESIILCPDHVQLICLSATVSNADEIAQWISRTHRPIRLITHTERAVPLALYYFHDGTLHLTVDDRGRLVKDFPHTGGEARRQPPRGARSNRRAGDRAAIELDEPQPREIIDALAKLDMLPAIYFLFSRNDCQTFAERLAAARPGMIGPMQSALIDQTIEAVLAGLRPEDRDLEQVKVITSLARRGIGFHHAGLLPILKQLVEVLFGRGLMEVVFATDTLALGVNMPARTVVIGRMSKWDGRRRRALIPNEFQQMAGRAGRRGMDRFGHVVVPYSPWFTFRESLEIATGELHPVRSAFAIRYNTVLNLWDPPDGERVRSMLQQSLDQFQTSQRVRQLEGQIAAAALEAAAVPTGCLLGLADGEDLLEGYRQVNRALTSAQGREKRIADETTALSLRLETSTPWPEPGRQTLRRVFRTAQPGLVAHLRDEGWGVYLGATEGQPIGRFLVGERIVPLLEYRNIDHLTEHVVALPDALVDPAQGAAQAGEVITDAELTTIWDAVSMLGLPDLDAQLVEHRLREEVLVREDAARLNIERAEIDTELATLHAERAAHPCHICERRKEHRDLIELADRLVKDQRHLEGRLEHEIDAEEERIRGVIRGIRNVLHRFGYLHRGYPTEKADMLAEVFDNDGLILCEAIDRGMLDGLKPEELAEVFSWFSFDREFRYSNTFVLGDRLTAARRRLEEIERAVLGEERAEGLEISDGHNPNFYGAARAWCLGSTMAEIGERLELSEGDLVVTFNKTIDLMRQLREMLMNIAPEHPVRFGLAAAEHLMKRDIVAQSLAIGFAPVALPEVSAAELEAAKAEVAAARPVRAPRKTAAPKAKPGASGDEKPKRATRTAKPKSESDTAPTAAPPKRTRKSAAPKPKEQTSATAEPKPSRGKQSARGAVDGTEPTAKPVRKRTPKAQRD